MNKAGTLEKFEMFATACQGVGERSRKSVNRPTKGDAICKSKLSLQGLRSKGGRKHNKIIKVRKGKTQGVEVKFIA